MIIVTGQVRFAEGEIARLAPAFGTNIEATRAEAGCARYAYAVDVGDPNLLHVVEEWSDEEAVNAHMNTPHMAELMTALGSAKIEAISINAYEARNALDDAAPERRGINSIQLFKDPERGWRIMAMIWDNEREGLRLPAF